MKLYHCSKKLLESLKPQQAQGEISPDVPAEELDRAIYLTSDYGYALAMGSRPDGVTHIDRKEKKIEFENPELFSPDEHIYIYEIDSDAIPKENLQQLKEDELQWKVTGLEIPMSELQIKKVRSREVMDYYELTNWRENKEDTKEINKEIGFR